MRTRCGRSAQRAAIGVAALFLLTGCGGGERSSPEGAVRGWLDALEARDTAKAHDAFTERTRELVDEIGRLGSAGREGHPVITIEDWCRTFCGATVEGSTLHGDSATVRIRIDDDVDRLPVVRGGEGWKIELSGNLEPAVELLRERESADPLP
ncbi:MAG: hypothetical protein R3199_01615 [Gemmatimonadota bacterium]|nr:hypothetical protein [Gemmatimonadota bacterium]